MVRSGRTLIYWLFCGKLRILVLGGDVHNSKHVVMAVCERERGGGSFRMSLISWSASNPNLIFIVIRTHDN